MTKTLKKPPSVSQNDGESPLGMVTGMLETGLVGLRAYIDTMSPRVGESRDVEAVESFAHLLTKVAQVAGELRKAEAAERKQGESMTDADIIEKYRRMTDAEADSLRRKLDAARKKGSGLA